uniref:Uncharacterized protein n=1 Tax=Romanomermis culicivorax TaxID=13658 RepID=A0A915IYJ9_ROMCU
MEGCFDHREFNGRDHFTRCYPKCKQTYSSDFLGRDCKNTLRSMSFGGPATPAPCIGYCIVSNIGALLSLRSNVHALIFNWKTS